MTDKFSRIPKDRSWGNVSPDIPSFGQHSLKQPQERRLTFQEQFSFYLLVGKFILSKFGLFFLFFFIHVGSRYSSGSYIRSVIARPELHQPSFLSTLFLSQKSFKPNKNSDESVSPLPSSSQSFVGGTSNEALNSFCGSTSKFDFIYNQISQKIRIYCIIGTIVTLFLNPQQTKYFGGLAVVLKQAGFFTKYSKSEKMVYIFSWIFVILFFSSSIQLASLARDSSWKFH